MAGSSYLETLGRRVLVYDGAMGTSIQQLGLTETDFGGPGLLGCNDHLVLSRPDVVEAIHASFLEVGCDVVETDTFRANRLTLAEYGLQDRAVEMNRVAAQLARRIAAGFATPRQPRFVAGSIGPSGYLPSTTDPTLGQVRFDELVTVFAEQAQGLVEGGVDVLLIETGQDLLEVRAQIVGVRRCLRALGRSVAVQAQVTLDTSGRMLLGTDISAAMVVLEAMRVDVLGLNCSTGPEHMRQPVRYLCEHSRLPISVIPNAGIPHNEGGVASYPLTPAQLAAAHEEFVTRFGVNIVGGCCGTTPAHLAPVVECVGGRSPRPRTVPAVPRAASAMSAIALHQDPPPTLIGERVNTQGSRAVKRLLLAEDYDGVLEVARGQVEGGAHLLDVCVALTEREDEAAQMRTLVKLLAQGVEAPLMIDTTEYDVVQAALEQYPGRAIINSINLENGRQRIDAVLPHAAEHGAALVALTIDEEGMAKTAARKLAVARRIHQIVTSEYDLAPDALIFDALTFTLATGDAEFRRSAVETIEGIRLIREALPGVLTSLGVSNVSFGLAPHARAVLNSVFLHHCVAAGLDMAIVHPAHITPYAEIDAEQRGLADDLIFDRRDDALTRFIAYFEVHEEAAEAVVDPTAELTVDQALHWKILHRKREGIEELIDAAVSARLEGAEGGVTAESAEDAEGLIGGVSAEEAEGMEDPAGSGRLGRHEAGVAVLNDVLLPAMKEVGDKFGAGELILPFVLQSAEVMKRAVSRVEQYLEKVEGQSKGKVVLATVFGDVHDIGKNLVHTILANNGYTVFDLGKQVPVNTILEKAEEVQADAIGLSALLVSTSRQMPLCVQELHSRGLRYPVLCGGAAINPSFVRAAAFVDRERDLLYPAGVFYCKDAFDGLSAVERLVDGAKREAFVRQRHAEVRAGVARRAALQEQARRTRPAERTDRPGAAEIPTPPFLGIRTRAPLPLPELFRLIDRNTLYRLHWGAKNASGEAWERLVQDEFMPRLQRYQTEASSGAWPPPRGLYGYFPAAADGDTLVIYDPEDPERERERFSFPRQTDREHLCLADYFVPVDRGRRDVVALQVVTAGDALLHRADALMKGGDYSEGYYLHGFGVRLAEAAAEYLHRHIRQELGLPADRGLRYSWGYPACPDIMQHAIVFRLLPVREVLGMELTTAGALVPELSTAALVVHHSEAKYFGA